MATRDGHAAPDQPRDATTHDLYLLYLRVMRRVGHYRWFAVFMKHAGSRADRALIRASCGRLSLGGPPDADDVAHHEGGKTKRQRANRSGVLCAGQQHSGRGMRELRARRTIQLAKKPPRRPEGAHRDQRRQCQLPFPTGHRARSRAQHAQARRNVARSRHLHATKRHTSRICLRAGRYADVKSSVLPQVTCRLAPPWSRGGFGSQVR